MCYVHFSFEHFSLTQVTFDVSDASNVVPSGPSLRGEAGLPGLPGLQGPPGLPGVCDCPEPVGGCAREGAVSAAADSQKTLDTGLQHSPCNSLAATHALCKR